MVTILYSNRIQTLAALFESPELDFVTAGIARELTGRIRQLAERYAAPLPQIVNEVEQLAAKVAAHLEKMGVKA